MAVSPEHVRNPHNIIAAAVLDHQPATSDNLRARELHRHSREKNRVNTFTADKFNEQILDPEGISNSTIDTICRKIQKRWVEHPGPPPTAGFEPVTVNGAATETALRSQLELAQRFYDAPEFATLNPADQTEIRDQLMQAIIDAPQTDSLDPAERALAVNQMLENRFKELKKKLFAQVKALKDKEMGDEVLEDGFNALLSRQEAEAQAQRIRNQAEQEVNRLTARQADFNDHNPGHLGADIDDLERQVAALETPAGGTRDITYRQRLGKEKERLDGEINALSEEINTQGTPATVRQGRSVRRERLVPRMNEVNKLIAEYDSVKNKLDTLINERDGREVEENGRRVRKGGIQEKIKEADQAFFEKEQDLAQKQRMRLLAQSSYEDKRDERDINERTLSESGARLFTNATTELIKTQVADTLAARDEVAEKIAKEQKDALHASLRRVVNNRWITRKRDIKRGHLRTDYRFKENVVKDDFAYLLAHGPEETSRHVLQSAGVPNAQIDSMLANPDIKKEIDQDLIQQLMANRIFVGKISQGDGKRLVQSDWYDQYVPQALLAEGSVRKKLEGKFETLKKEGVIPKDAVLNKRWAVYVLGTLGLTAAGAVFGGPAGIVSAGSAALGAMTHIQPKASKGAATGFEAGVLGFGGWEIARRIREKKAKASGRHH